MGEKTSLLAKVQHAGRYGDQWPVKHAREQMRERHASPEDVRLAILSATVAIDQPDNGTIRLEGGTDSDGDELKVVVAFDPRGLRVISVF